MKTVKILSGLLVLGLLSWGIELLYLAQRNASAPSRIKWEQDRERRAITLEYKKKERELREEYETRKYVATGQTVYDRIFNTQEQSVTDLIRRIAREALPEDWSCDVKVEEFTHFILLIYLPHKGPEPKPADVASLMQPVLRYCGWCLSDVGVFGPSHKSYLFFDSEILADIKKRGALTSAFTARARRQGGAFTRFNSVTIRCKAHASHLFVPIEIAGPDGVVSCLALFDTGASITTLANGVVAKTGTEELSRAPRRSFSTAKGLMSCPIVRRDVKVGRYRRSIEVAVNQRDGMNLLGVNFFEGMEYIVDSRNSCIYVWEK